MKKSRKGIFVVVGCLIVIILLGGFLFKGLKDDFYSKPMKNNWSINLPDGYEKVEVQREDESSSNALGDGNRYTVIKYDKAPVFEDDVIWVDSMSESEKDEITEVMKTMDTAAYPDDSKGNLKYYSKANGNNKLWMIYDEDTNLLYIVEELF